MAVTALDNLALDLTEEIRVQASLDATFEALLEEMGPHNTGIGGVPMPMVIEARPGGRWYPRSRRQQRAFLGTRAGDQARPTLLEITGPLFMSMPVVSNLQYRLKEVDGGTLISFRHSALGFIPDDFRQGLMRGWAALHDRVRTQAEARR